MPKSWGVVVLQYVLCVLLASGLPLQRYSPLSPGIVARTCPACPPQMSKRWDEARQETLGLSEKDKEMVSLSCCDHNISHFTGHGTCKCTACASAIQQESPRETLTGSIKADALEWAQDRGTHWWRHNEDVKSVSVSMSGWMTVRLRYKPMTGPGVRMGAAVVLGMSEGGGLVTVLVSFGVVMASGSAVVMSIPGSGVVVSVIFKSKDS